MKAREKEAEIEGNSPFATISCCLLFLFFTIHVVSVSADGGDSIQQQERHEVTDIAPTGNCTCDSSYPGHEDEKLKAKLREMEVKFHELATGNFFQPNTQTSNGCLGKNMPPIAKICKLFYFQLLRWRWQIVATTTPQPLLLGPR